MASGRHRITSKGAGFESGVPANWYWSHLEAIGEADAIIRTQLSNRNHLGEHTVMALCDEVFSVVKTSLDSADVAQNSSVLLLGESGSGKTHVVEWCVKQLREVVGSLIVLRAHGGMYATDVECLRHLASQVSDQLLSQQHANASFEQGMEWFRNVLRESFKHAGAVVVVLDRFEHFCSRSRQTLLYNLFDIAQEVGVNLSIIGTSERMNVMDCLEKRIKSRFSMRHLHCFLPATVEELVAVLMAKLRLDAECGLPAAFLARFHKYVELALRAHSREWKAEVEAGRPPAWFLHRCVPVSALLLRSVEEKTESAHVVEPPLKKAKKVYFGSLPSLTEGDVLKMTLEGLSEVQHILLLGLYRLHLRGSRANLNRLLLEVQRLHTEAGQFLPGYSADRYCALFDDLLQAKLVELPTGNKDLPKFYSPCNSLVNKSYASFVKDLEAKASKQALAFNPLRALPAAIQHWAIGQRT